VTPAFSQRTRCKAHPSADDALLSSVARLSSAVPEIAERLKEDGHHGYFYREPDGYNEYEANQGNRVHDGDHRIGTAR